MVLNDKNKLVSTSILKSCGNKFVDTQAMYGVQRASFGGRLPVAYRKGHSPWRVPLGRYRSMLAPVNTERSSLRSRPLRDSGYGFASPITPCHNTVS